MAKVLKIDRKQLSVGRELVTVQRRSEKRNPRISMSQEDVWKIFNRVSTFHSPEQTYENLILELPTRGHLTHWLGQIGHRFDVKLGRGRDFEDFLKEIANRLWKRSQELSSGIDDKKEGIDMENIGLDVDQTTIPLSEGEVIEETPNGDVSEDIAQFETPDLETTSASPDKTQAHTALHIGRIQGYWIATMKIFADCAVQNTQEGIFDVLGRNFESSGELSWWLWRIGHADKCKYTKRKDIVDAIRKVSAELHKDLRRDVGRQVCRW